MSDLGFAVKYGPFGLTGLFTYLYFVEVVGLRPSDPNTAVGLVLFFLSVVSFVGLGLLFWRRPEWTTEHDVELPALVGSPPDQNIPEEMRIQFDAILSFGYAALLLLLGGAAAGLY